MPRKPPFFDNHPHPFPELATFRGVCVHVVDGDTFDVFIDLGCYEYAFKAVRLNNIDTPETYRPASPEEKLRGDKATEFVKSLILNKQIKLVTNHKTTLDRLVADVYYYEPVLGEWFDLARVLRENGHEKIIPQV